MSTTYPVRIDRRTERLVGQLAARCLMARYRDLPMDLADAALVRLAEREQIQRIFTVDWQDFHAYRPKGIRAFEIVP